MIYETKNLNNYYILVWIKIMINFQNKTQNPTKFAHFWNLHIYSTIINTNHVIDWATICILKNKLQKISLKKKLYEKVKWLKKRTTNPFVK
jgi:hypothetical protein